MADITMRQRWFNLVEMARLASPIPNLPAMVRSAERTWDEIERAYTGKGRYYHNLTHIWQGLEVLDQLGASIETRVAWFMHDLVYVPGSPTNEVESVDAWIDIANLFPRLLPTGISFLEEVSRLIMITKDHKPEPFDRNGRDIVVADLYGLAASSMVYRTNTFKIRCEFSSFKDEEWLEGRKAFLESRMPWEPFPSSPEFVHLNKRAKANMSDEYHRMKALHGS